MTVDPGTTLPYSGIVSVDELKTYMASINLNTPQSVSAALTLAGTQQALENYLNRPLEPVQMREVLWTDAQGIVNVSVSPVHKVISADAIDSVWSAFDVYQTGYIPPVGTRDPLIGPNGQLLDHLYPTVNDPMLVPGGIYIGLPNVAVAVDYVAGYNGYVVEGLKQAIKMVAARTVGKNHDETISLRGPQAQEAQPSDDRPLGWTKEELEQWDRLRRRVIA